MNAEKHYAGKVDIASEYAERIGITKKEAHKRLEDILEVATDFIIHPDYDGIIVKDMFTVEKITKSARSGKMPINGINYKTFSAQKLKIRTGKKLSALMNL